MGRTKSGFVRRSGISSDLPPIIAAIRSLKSSTLSTGRCSFTASLKLFAKPSGVANCGRLVSKDAIGLCEIAPFGWGFHMCSPYRHGRDCGTTKPGKKKQKRYDYACAVLSIHRLQPATTQPPVERLYSSSRDRNCLPWGKQEVAASTELAVD